MKNLNGNLLCSIDVETSGFDPNVNSMLEIAIVPLDDLCRVSKHFPILEMQLRPWEGAMIEYDALKTQFRVNSPNASDPGDQHSQKITIEKEFLTRCILGGVDYVQSSEIFYEWFNDLKLAPRKRIVPLAHNWIFDRKFVDHWLGGSGAEHHFDPRYRDTLAVSNFENDIADFRNEPFPYPKNRLSEVCTRLGVQQRSRHRALDDAVNTAEAYRRIMQTSFCSTRLVTPEDITYKCAVCEDTQVTKIINSKPYCGVHTDPNIKVLSVGA